jgi:hypothetical protein
VAFLNYWYTLRIALQTHQTGSGPIIPAVFVQEMNDTPGPPAAPADDSDCLFYIAGIKDDPVRSALRLISKSRQSNGANLDE